MSIVRVPISLVVWASLASLAGTAWGQAPPTPSPEDAPAPPPAPAPPEPTPPAASPTLDPATRDAAVKARAAHVVLEVTNPATVRGCRDLGEVQVAATSGARGRLQIRAALTETARTRGASHIRYSDHVVLGASSTQRERGHFYDCTTQSTTPPSAVDSDNNDAAPAPPSAVGPDGNGAAPASPSTAGPDGTGVAPAPRLPIACAAQLELLPVGTLRSSEAIAAAYGVSGSVEWPLTPYVAFGVNPGVVLGLKADGANVNATEFDVRAQLRLGKTFAEGFSEYGYASVGASLIAFPGDAPTATGAVVGFGLAVSHPVEHAGFVTVEVGYQLGFQETTVGTTSVDIASRLFHIALGIGRYL